MSRPATPHALYLRSFVRHPERRNIRKPSVLFVSTISCCQCHCASTYRSAGGRGGPPTQSPSRVGSTAVVLQSLTPTTMNPGTGRCSQGLTTNGTERYYLRYYLERRTSLSLRVAFYGGPPDYTSEECFSSQTLRRKMTCASKSVWLIIQPRSPPAQRSGVCILACHCQQQPSPIQRHSGGTQAPRTLSILPTGSFRTISFALHSLAVNPIGVKRTLTTEPRPLLYPGCPMYANGTIRMFRKLRHMRHWGQRDEET